VSLGNWTKFHSPGEPLKNFTRSEPHNEWIKDTYVGGLRKPTKKRNGKMAAKALKKRWE
jgi:hypothetical protein